LKLKVLNIEARPDPQAQFIQYMTAAETIKSRYDTVVTTSLLGEERILWPHQDIQFYIIDGQEEIKTTGNPYNLQEFYEVRTKGKMPSSPKYKKKTMYKPEQKSYYI